jgi:tetratricopeptide (TPR) repeat protein
MDNIRFENGTYRTKNQRDFGGLAIKNLLSEGERIENEGDYKGAQNKYFEALGLAEKEFGKHSKDYTHCQFCCSDILLKRGRYYEALRIKLDLQENEAHVYGEFDGERIGTINDIAMVFETLYEFDKAILCYKWATRLVEVGKDRFHIWYNYGCLLKDRGDLEGALNCFKKFMDSPEANANDHDPVTGNALHKIAAVHNHQGNLEQAKKYYLQSIDVHKKHMFYHELSNTLHNTANFYLKNKQYKEAKDYFKQAIDINLKSNDIDSALSSYYYLFKTAIKSKNVQNIDKLISVCFKVVKADFTIMRSHFIQIGKLLIDHDLLREAESIHSKLLEAVLKLESKNTVVKYCFNVGRNYLEKNYFKEANQYFLEGEKIVSWKEALNNPDDERDIVDDILSVAEVSLHLKDFVQYKKVMELFSEIDEDVLLNYSENLENIKLTYLLEKNDFGQFVAELNTLSLKESDSNSF